MRELIGFLHLFTAGPLSLPKIEVKYKNQDLTLNSHR